MKFEDVLQSNLSNRLKGALTKALDKDILSKPYDFHVNTKMSVTITLFGYRVATLEEITEDDKKKLQLIGRSGGRQIFMTFSDRRKGEIFSNYVWVGDEVLHIPYKSGIESAVEAIRQFSPVMPALSPLRGSFFFNTQDVEHIKYLQKAVNASLDVDPDPHRIVSALEYGIKYCETYAFRENMKLENLSQVIVVGGVPDTFYAYTPQGELLVSGDSRILSTEAVHARATAHVMNQGEVKDDLCGVVGNWCYFTNGMRVFYVFNQTAA